jgi:hypothetical protein
MKIPAACCGVLITEIRKTGARPRGWKYNHFFDSVDFCFIFNLKIPKLMSQFFKNIVTVLVALFQATLRFVAHPKDNQAVFKMGLLEAKQSSHIKRVTTRIVKRQQKSRDSSALTITLLRNHHQARKGKDACIFSRHFVLRWIHIFIVSQVSTTRASF